MVVETAYPTRRVQDGANGPGARWRLAIGVEGGQLPFMASARA